MEPAMAQFVNDILQTLEDARMETAQTEDRDFQPPDPHQISSN